VGKYQAQGISQGALTALCQHNWPGNVRELHNAIERALTVCKEEEIQPCHLPPAVLQKASPLSQINKYLENQNMVEAVEQFERGMILAALEKSYWNKTQAASALGVTRRILAYKMQNLGIERTEPEHLREN
jgi:two-component system response regulator PilR (NtrC family)